MDDVTNLFEVSFRKLEIEIDGKTIEKLKLYSKEIIRFGKRINLTGSPDIEVFIKGPLFDALTLMKALTREESMVDVGSGGGLPGIPTAILAPNIRMTLVEPRGRRASRHAGQARAAPRPGS